MNTTVSVWRRRWLKRLAGLSAALGVLATFIGVVAGLSMGGSLFTGKLTRDLWTLAFLGLPGLQVAVFIIGTLKDRTDPGVAAWLYTIVILILVMVPALLAIV